jgi:GH15 family glucan-1,4-alpha-glucosidase
VRRLKERGVLVLAALVTSALALGMTPGRLTMGPEEALRTAPGYRTAARTAAGPTPDEVAWLAAGTVPGSQTRWADMAQWALLDLRAFQSAHGSVAAGPGGPWGYFWPRDGSFAAVAFAVTGHATEAAQVLDQLSRLELDPAVGFQARYRLDGTALTDRPPQSDGCGWVLWALDTVRRADPTALPSSSRGLRDGCLGVLTRLVRDGRRLPPPSPDYWELPVSEVSLGTLAPILAGLVSGARDLSATGDDSGAARVRVVAQDLAALMVHELGPQFERFGDHGGHDAAVTMLLPPLIPTALLPAGTAELVGAARDAYQRGAGQPAGGVAPGSRWVKRDGASWTPQTALLALSDAATGRTDPAGKWLDWLDGHRTAYGSLPEKVTRSGRPAGPAPLTWTAALVLLTLHELDPAVPTVSLPGR